MSIQTVLSQFNSLSEEQKAALLKRKDVQEYLEEATAGLKWIPNPGPQTDAYYSKADILFYGGESSGGKGFRKDQCVLTPFGWKQIGTLKTGSVLCSTDGTAQKVIAVYNRGVQPLYKLLWSDGSETVCDEDHIWLGWIAGGTRKIANISVCGSESASKWTTRQIYEYYQKNTKYRFGIPVISKPCVFNVQGENRGQNKHISRSIHPYILGVLLGDGSIVDGDGSFTSGDDEIPQRVESIIGEKIGKYTSDTKCTEYRIPNRFIKEHLEDLQLSGCRSYDKFIPRIYLFGTVEERWELLRGLMDTDGWCEDDGDCYFSSSSKKLADDVRHLARSLGAIVTWREKVPFYTYKGERKEGLRSYTLRIKIPQPDMMFHLERKKSRCRDRKHKSMGIWLNAIVPFGYDETVCIRVSHPNSLFITEDFIVTHNTGLLIGLSLTAHKRSLIIRRRYTDLDAIVEDLLQKNGTRDGYNGAPPPRLRTKDGRLIELGACANIGDELFWAGRPHDLLGIDETWMLSEEQVRNLMGWVRTTEPGQRCRIVFASNPPPFAEGIWLTMMFAPWVDPNHPNPAKDGELRWYVTDKDGKDHEVSGPDPVEMDGEVFSPMSRTFIRASMEDNPFIDQTQYQKVLDSMRGPLRDAIRDGKFAMSFSDDDRQLIPTKWIQEAMDRWTERAPDVPMTSIGVDPAQGGNDNNVIALRYGHWYAPLIVVPGSKTPLGTDISGLIITKRKDHAEIVLDCGGGYGGSIYKHFSDNGIDINAYKGAAQSHAKSNDGQLRFVNKRTETYWRFMEALDPSQSGGSKVCLPKDSELLADLAAIRYKSDSVRGKAGIKLDPKDKAKEVLGRSPDKGDAVVMAWSVNKQHSYTPEHGGRNYKPKVITAYQSAKRKGVQYGKRI